MNKNSGIKLLGRAPNRLKRRIVEIQGLEPSRMLIGIDVGTDFRAKQAQFTNTTFELVRRQIRILQWNRRQPNEPFWVVANHIGNVIVEPAREIECVL